MNEVAHHSELSEDQQHLPKASCSSEVHKSSGKVHLYKITSDEISQSIETIFIYVVSDAHLAQAQTRKSSTVPSPFGLISILDTGQVGQGNPSHGAHRTSRE